MRGKEVDGLRFVCRPGITPAYAGKRVAATVSKSIVWDHPRVCGEKLNSTACFRLESGSPPRMRGKASFHADPHDEGRITPAYAGKSGGHHDALHQVQDHPRVCGEKWQS